MELLFPQENISNQMGILYLYLDVLFFDDVYLARFGTASLINSMTHELVCVWLSCVCVCVRLFCPTFMVVFFPLSTSPFIFHYHLHRLRVFISVNNRRRLTVEALMSINTARKLP